MFIYYGHKFIITKLINNTGNTLHRVINSGGYKANKALRWDVKYFHCISLHILDYTKNISKFADLHEIFYAMYQVLIFFNEVFHEETYDPISASPEVYFYWSNIKKSNSKSKFYRRAQYEIFPINRFSSFRTKSADKQTLCHRGFVLCTSCEQHIIWFHAFEFVSPINKTCYSISNCNWYAHSRTKHKGTTKILTSVTWISYILISEDTYMRPEYLYLFLTATINYTLLYEASRSDT
jgi:hypothetical protein